MRLRQIQALGFLATLWLPKNTPLSRVAAMGGAMPHPPGHPLCPGPVGIAPLPLARSSPPAPAIQLLAPPKKGGGGASCQGCGWHRRRVREDTTQLCHRRGDTSDTAQHGTPPHPPGLLIIISFALFLAISQHPSAPRPPDATAQGGPSPSQNPAAGVWHPPNVLSRPPRDFAAPVNQNSPFPEG